MLDAEQREFAGEPIVHGKAHSRAVRVSAAAARFLDAVFRTPATRLSVGLVGVLVAALYLSGVLHWAYFLNWGKAPFDLHDWTQAGAYYSFLQDAARQNRLPLHMDSNLVTTDRYLGRPDTPISPQIYLLRFLDPGQFTLANTLLLYSVGFLGLLVFRRRYGLSAASFSVLFLLFNFNGHLTAHLAVGHTMWVGYFFLPFFFLLVFRLLENPQPGWRWVLLVALVLFGIFIQGAFHFAFWCLIFLLALGVFYPVFLKPILRAAVAAGLLSLVRILPPLVEFSSGTPEFISGFITAQHILEGLVILKHPSQALEGPFSSLAWWEMDHYIGLLGASLLAYFGVFTGWRQRRRRWVALAAPLGVLVFLSIGEIYSVLFSLPVPVLHSERVTSRFLILPLVALFFLSSIHLQQYWDRSSPRSWRANLAWVMGLLLLGHDLLQHSRVWRVANMYQLFPRTPVDYSATVINHADPPYITALIIGTLTSLLTLSFLLWKTRAEKTRF